MIDQPVILRAYLVAPSALTVLVADRVWEERVNPIQGWTPEDGEAICFRARGSGRLDYTSQLVTQSWMFKCYGDSEHGANAVYRALVDRLHDAQTASMRIAQLELTGQSLQEAHPLDWHYTLCFFQTIMLAQIMPA